MADIYIKASDITFDEKEEPEEKKSLQGDIILRTVHVTGADKSDLDTRMEALKKHSVLNIEVVQTCKKMFDDRYGDMVRLYVENSHERVEELLEAFERDDMQSMIRPAHTLKVMSVQMGASKLFYMAKEFEAFLKNAARGNSSALELSQTRGIIQQIEIVLSETENTFVQLLALSDE